MAMLDFLKKKDTPIGGAPISGTPTEYVVSMQQQGLTNNQIIQILTKQGYNQTQIYDALNQAALKSTITGAVPIGPGDLSSPMTTPPPMPSGPSGPSGLQGPGPMQMQMPQSDMSRAQSSSFEELAESIIEEKWRDVQKKMDKDKEWRDSAEIRLGKAEQQLADLRAEIDNLHRAIVAKIGDYDKSLLSVGTEIRAMEKVFQKILPELSENVSELGRITKSAKGIKKAETK